MMLYKKMFQFVDNYLSQSNVPILPFRKRSDHIKRVFMWSQRLIPKEYSINKEALLIAAIFHDVGYATCSNFVDHAENGAVICQDYLKSHNYDEDMIAFIVYLVRNHSNKDLMTNKDTPLELILLMEADLLDETGALSITWDCMSEGSQEVQSFEKTHAHIMKYSYKDVNSNPMITELGKNFWEKKQTLTSMFIEQLSFDLGIYTYSDPNSSFIDL